MDFLLPGHAFDPRYHFGMIASTMCDRGTMSYLDITVRALVDAWIIRGVRDVYDQGDVRLQCVSDLARAHQAYFLHDIGHGEDLRLHLFLALSQKPQSLCD